MCRPEILPPDDRVSELARRLRHQPGAAAASSGRHARSADHGQHAPANRRDGAAHEHRHQRDHLRRHARSGLDSDRPERAGKTTYTRAVGLAHALFQAGLYVPARSARLSPVDAIYTHFPSRSRPSPAWAAWTRRPSAWPASSSGRRRCSLVLLNETLAGTAASEAEALARDAVRGLRLLGARAVYVTHLHDLALTVDELNATTPGTSLVGSLVADADDEAGLGDRPAAPPHLPDPPGRAARPELRVGDRPAVRDQLRAVGGAVARARHLGRPRLTPTERLA